jgi:hypothetical protein
MDPFVEKLVQLHSLQGGQIKKISYFNSLKKGDLLVPFSFSDEWREFMESNEDLLEYTFSKDANFMSRVEFTNYLIEKDIPTLCHLDHKTCELPFILKGMSSNRKSKTTEIKSLNDYSCAVEQFDSFIVQEKKNIEENLRVLIVNSEPVLFYVKSKSNPIEKGVIPEDIMKYVTYIIKDLNLSLANICIVKSAGTLYVNKINFFPCLHNSLKINENIHEVIWSHYLK